MSCFQNSVGRRDGCGLGCGRGADRPGRDRLDDVRLRRPAHRLQSAGEDARRRQRRRAEGGVDRRPGRAVADRADGRHRRGAAGRPRPGLRRHAQGRPPRRRPAHRQAGLAHAPRQPQDELRRLPGRDGGRPRHAHARPLPPRRLRGGGRRQAARARRGERRRAVGLAGHDRRQQQGRLRLRQPDAPGLQRLRRDRERLRPRPLPRAGGAGQPERRAQGDGPLVPGRRQRQALRRRHLGRGRGLERRVRPLRRDRQRHPLQPRERRPRRAGGPPLPGAQGPGLELPERQRLRRRLRRHAAPLPGQGLPARR